MCESVRDIPWGTRDLDGDGNVAAADTGSRRVMGRKPQLRGLVERARSWQELAAKRVCTSRPVLAQRPAA
jgi:hypothetical protein